MFCSIQILFLSQNFASQSILLKSLQLNILGGVLFHERGGWGGRIKIVLQRNPSEHGGKLKVLVLMIYV